MHRFFLKPDQIDKNQVFFLPEEARQIKNVLRLSAGDRVIVLDNRGGLYSVEIAKSDNKTLKGNIIKKESKKVGSSFSLSLGQALIKGPKIDFIIQKATELGVEDIAFVETERTVVKYKDVIGKNRLARWEKIAKEAAEQSQRLTVPTITCVKNLEEFFSLNKHSELKLIFWEEENKKRLRDFIENDIDISRLSLLIGPEGGFSKKEIDLACRFGFVPAGLGPQILKAETAAISILSIIQYVKGGLG